jgi:hypothetical protein
VSHQTTEPLSEEDALYYLGPVTPHVLALTPGDTESLFEFVEVLGIVGLVKWAGGPGTDTTKPGLSVWEPLSAAVLTRDSTLNAADLEAAWTHPRTIETFSIEHERLTQAWNAATDDGDPKRALTRQLLKAFFQEPYPYELEFAVTSKTGKIVERPRHVLARSGFELMDAMESRLPRRCELFSCRQPVPPGRSDQRYCTKRHQQTAFQLEYDRTDYRRSYQRMYRRYKRGSITEAEWLDWKNSAKRKNS